ncbi:Transcriptional activator spt7 [Malassezia psittaci]|uniref:Transcriptional activator spt7 n=1 Tax=Malassezia psittaci TaxID=1821823 RepID=A0AAF0FCJ8_9BASI|nr:Transcriptional activator spt7 [Malassezia psittaci]
MDLGTMQKKLKSAQYKNKAQFQYDLNLIWDNCFLYNASPTHPLRRSAAQMRKKANHLLEFLSEKSEIKDMLSHWQPPVPSEHVKERDSSPPTPPIVTETKATHPKSADIAKPRGTDAPFAQRVALRRSSDSTLVFSELDARLASAAIQGASGASSSSSNDILFESRKLSKTMSMLGQVSQSSHVAPLQSALQRSTPSENSTISAPEAIQAWWTSCGSDAMLCAGLPSVQFSGTARRKDPIHMPDVTSSLPSQRPGIPRMMARNIHTLRRLHHTHQKFFWLAEVVEHELPIPADLAQVSSDEEDEHGRDMEDDLPDDDDIQDGLDGARQDVHQSKRLAPTQTEPNRKLLSSRNKSTTPSHIPEPRMRTSIQQELIADTSPFPRLTQRYAREQVSWQVELILAHTGLDGSQANALQVLTDVTCDYMMGLARNLRLYTDRYATQMRAEQMIQHTLQSSGGTCVEKLHSYIRTDIERYGARLREWLRKLQVAYRDQLTNIGRAVVEDDELLARDGEALSLGHFAEGLGEDFFGFRELGLDRELGLAGLAVPRRLFYGTSTSTNRETVHGESAAEPAYHAPPPLVLVSRASLPAQIGLLRGWYETHLVHGDTPKPTDIVPEILPEKPRYKVPTSGKLPSRPIYGANSFKEPASSNSDASLLKRKRLTPN